MSTPAAGGFVRAVGALVCLAGAVALQLGRDAAYPRTASPAESMLYVRSAAAMNRIALGFDAIAADLYWIRAIQHYGAQRLAEPGTPRNYGLLFPMLDLATSLDPYFNIAYRFGGIFLSEPLPGGPGRPDQAVQLLRKGIAAQPGKWQYYHDIGFVHYWALQDHAGAAAWFRRAAEQPNAPNWLMPVAAAVLSQGSDRTSARYLWQQMLSAEQEWLRRRAERALVQLDALDQIDQLNARIASVPRGGGGLSWIDVVRAGRLPGIPLDPAGTPYDLDPVSGRVRVSDSSPLFPMPQVAAGR